MSTDLAVLMALRVQAVASPGRAAAALGMAHGATVERLDALVSEGLATLRTGRLEGYTLTEAGRSRLEADLSVEGLRDDQLLRECYERFLALNDDVLRLSTDWQKRDGADATPIISRLGALHDRARVATSKLAAVADRFAPYRDRLAACLERVEDGDTEAFTASMTESYHTVWFELHQDLLLTLGIERGAE